MIISASRRTDIPARFSDWFFHRLEAGYVLTRNPFNIHQVSKISLSSNVVDGFVFWTKNPIPMMDRLSLLQHIPYYIQFTLTPYGPDLEPNVPNKQDILIPAFRSLAEQIGPERLVWRYDPILFTNHYSMEYHLHYFSRLANRLEGASDTCVISFFDAYRHLQPSIRQLGLNRPTDSQIMELAAYMQETAAAHGFRLLTCSEHIDLSAYGIHHGQCIDGQRLSRISGVPLQTTRDHNQRSNCGCAASVDIGMYNCCANGCRYCYANHAPQRVKANLMQHDPTSPLLYGRLLPEDRVSERAMFSLQETQLNLF